MLPVFAVVQSSLVVEGWQRQEREAVQDRRRPTEWKEIDVTKSIN